MQVYRLRVVNEHNPMPFDELTVNLVENTEGFVVLEIVKPRKLRQRVWLAHSTHQVMREGHIVQLRLYENVDPKQDWPNRYDVFVRRERKAHAKGSNHRSNSKSAVARRASPRTISRER